MSASDAAPLPRLGEVFFDVRGSSRSMRLSWYADTGVAVFSIWQGGMCTGTFRLPIGDLHRMVETLRSGPGARSGDISQAAEPRQGPEPERFDSRQTQLPAAYQAPQAPPGDQQDLPEEDYARAMPAADHQMSRPGGDYPRGVPDHGYQRAGQAADYSRAAPEAGHLADRRSAYQDGRAAA